MKMRPRFEEVVTLYAVARDERASVDTRVLVSIATVVA